MYDVWSRAKRQGLKVNPDFEAVYRELIQTRKVLRTGKRSSNPIRRRGPNPRGKTPPHLKRFLFKKGHR